MKVKTSLLVALIATTGLMHGYTVSTSNYAGVSPGILAVVDNTGAFIAAGSGSVGVGYFGSLDDTAIGSAADFGALLTDFVAFGGEDAFGVAALGATPGLFSLSQDASIPNGGNAYTGKSIYTVIGNGATLATSDQLAVWKGTATFGQENELGLGSADSPVGGGTGSIVLGSSSGPLTLPVGAGFALNDGIQLTEVIPEPSSFLLLALGGAGFMIRRKR